ncbi:acetolactate decarboxylase [Rosettibacter firmus]|uniref:acetolactate decarboxylase n=1 Tax=Rosettibacter firmus TaxID=3111522 RepID=UPI00336C2ACA
MKRNALVLILFIISFLPFYSQSHKENNILFQVSLFDSLYYGNYNGFYNLNELLQYGNFGLGTFDKLDGEMTILNGSVYQFKSDGMIYKPELSLTTPFACIVNFIPDYFYKKNNLDKKSFIEYIDGVIINKNYFYAIKLSGRFSFIITRTIQVQEEPYKILNEVLKEQLTFEKNNITGTLVGFYFPEYADKINITGYHFHFISDDFNFGGHMLDFELEDGEIEIQKINQLNLLLR